MARREGVAADWVPIGFVAAAQLNGVDRQLIGKLIDCRFGWDKRNATPGSRREGEWMIGIGGPEMRPVSPGMFR